MHLKEAFRYQNKLEWLMSEAKDVLGREGNVTKVECTASYSDHALSRENIFSLSLSPRLTSPCSDISILGSPSGIPSTVSMPADPCF